MAQDDSVAVLERLIQFLQAEILKAAGGFQLGIGFRRAAAFSVRAGLDRQQQPTDQQTPSERWGMSLGLRRPKQ